jgi:hypothetical protein
VAFGQAARFKSYFLFLTSVVLWDYLHFSLTFFTSCTTQNFLEHVDTTERFLTRLSFNLYILFGMPHGGS